MAQTTTTADQIRVALTGGLIPAVPVMFDREHRFQQNAHKLYVAYMRTQPISGLAVWAHTGRGLHLTTEVARLVIEDWREALPEKILIAGVGTNKQDKDSFESSKATVEMAQRAAQYGADAILVYPPTWLKESEALDKLIVEHHSRLVDVGLPIILFYLYEAAGGISYSLDVLNDLLSLPNVVGIKMATLDSVMTFQDVASYIRVHHPEKLLITGEDRFLAYSLQRGARAALIGLGAVCCELQAELIASQLRGNSKRFLELSDAVDQLAEVLFVQPMEGYIGRILCALSKLGVIPNEASYDPWGPPISATEIGRIETVLSTLTASYAA